MVVGSNPAIPTNFFAEIVQLVERLICNQLVAGSTPAFGSEYVECWFSGKIVALVYGSSILLVLPNWQVAQLVERLTDIQEVIGSIPILPTPGR